MTTIETDCWCAGGLLEEVGYRVEIATNGEDGLKLFESSPFDVVVTDYRMPRMDGAELIRRIRLLKPNTRIILLSGFVDPLGLTEQVTGADVVIAKSSHEPGAPAQLVKRLINRALRANHQGGRPEHSCRSGRRAK
ncbi:MAG: response regulator [Ignavibacteriota bacterium]